jgi:serine/threonine-protein kinase
LTAGDVLSERYRLDQPLATGGMGQVWRATDLVLGRTVAVKLMLSRFDDQPGFARRFEAEARIMASLRHPGLVDVYDYGVTDDGRVYLVMQCVDGEPLSQRLEAGPLGVDETLWIIGQTARALQAVHRRGIVHRDVKPANLLVEPDATVRLVDFGIARGPAGTATTAHRVVGTALYMAPEQAMGRAVTPATDVYALGAVAHHCLTGSPPFPGDNPVQVALSHVQDPPPPLPPEIPEPVRALVATALAKDPADRYATGGELAAATDAARAGTLARTVVHGAAPAPRAAVPDAAAGPAATRSAPTPTHGWGPLATHRRGYAAAGVLLAAVLAMLVWLGLRGGDPAGPSHNPPPVAPTSGPSRGDGAGGGGGPSPTTETPTTTPTTTRPGSAPPTTSAPPPTAEPTPTPDTSPEPVEPPPTSEPAVTP